MNGAAGRFSHSGEGKIFDIYLCNMKNLNVKVINSSNTSCSYLVGWFHTQTLSDIIFWQGAGVGWGRQTKSTNFSSSFQVKFLPTAFNMNKIPSSTEKNVDSLYGPHVKSKCYNLWFMVYKRAATKLDFLTDRIPEFW